MGQIIEAKCTTCGLYKQLAAGTGRDSMMKKLLVPALDGFGNLFHADVYNLENRGLRFYHDSGMSDGQPSEILQWGRVVLSLDQNYCPKCNAKSMTFEIVGNWT